VEALLPTGTWIHWWNRTAHTGPGKLQFDVPLDSSVLLVKQGAIIPLLRASIDTLSPAAVPGVESFANDPGPLICRVFPGSQESTFDVVLGPKLAVTPGEDGYTVTFSSVTPAFDRVLFEVDLANLPAGAKAGSVPAGGDGKSYQAAASKDAVNECAGCYYFDGGDKMLYVSPPAGDGSFTF
jgi:hypothetical protein